MKKKTIIIILMIFLLVGCGSKKEEVTENKKNTQEKKEEYVELLNKYLTQTANKVNEGKNFLFYSVNYIYLIPFGHDEKKSCISLESGGESPFNKKWNYAYMAVVYDGNEYKYKILAEDGKGYRVDTEKKDLNNNGIDVIKKGTSKEESGYDVLYDYYNSVGENTILSKSNNSSEYKKLKEIVEFEDGVRDYIVIIGADDCYYEPTYPYY